MEKTILVLSIVNRDEDLILNGSGKYFLQRLKSVADGGLYRPRLAYDPSS